MQVAGSRRAESRKAAGGTLGDLRFRGLVPDADWNRLPAAVRERFSKRLAGDETATYVGAIVEAKFSRLGWWLAQAARVIGAPLPLSAAVHVPSIVSVTEDMVTGGQIWTRMYTRRDGFPQVIHSSKRFQGPTGLEEYLGFGVAMALDVVVEDDALLFRSAAYVLQVGRLPALRLPSWLAPGQCTVRHADLGAGEFLFSLELNHPRFGLLVRQAGIFREVTP